MAASPAAVSGAAGSLRGAIAAPDGSVQGSHKIGRGLMATLEHLRISLARLAPPPIVEILGAEDAPRPRLEYLTLAFGEKRSFIHGQHVFTFVPMAAPTGFAAGFFGRGVKLKGKKGPDQNYVPETIQTNDSALFIIDLADNSQIAVMEHKDSVGSPKAVLDAFFVGLRKTDGFRDYEPHVKYIATEETFWTAVEAYRGRITQINFTFIPPNALKSQQLVMELIKEAEAANSELVKHRYQSSTGKLDPKAPIIAGSVEVASQGGGETVVKSGARIIYSTSENRKTTDIPNDDVPKSAEESSLISGFIRRFFHWEHK
jgi:hypothetical protein